MYICVCTGAHRGQERASDILKLELVVSHTKKRVLETEPGSSARAASFLAEPSLQPFNFYFNMW